MKKRQIGIIVAVVLLAVGYGAYRFGVSHGKSTMTDADTSDTTAGKRVLYWHDPMQPSQHFDKPGKSPFMDMQLVPVYAEESKGDGAVNIDPRVQQRLGVRTAVVEKKRLAVQVNAVGTVQYNERDVADIQARAAGYLEKVDARTPLQFVAAGQVLADLYVPDWVAVQEDYLAIKRMQSSDAAGLLASSLQRMRLVGMTDEQIAAVSERNAVQARISVHAPIAGVVSELNAREGMSVVNGAPLFRINGLDTVWLYAEVPESKLAFIKAGAIVTAEATALPGVQLSGKILAVLPEVSVATRTAKARIELRNPKHALTPGMYVAAHLIALPQAPTLIVPTEAIIATGTRTIVIVSEEAGRFRPVVVQTGIESEGMTEILSGLTKGERVVVSAQFLIDSETSLKAAAMRMSEMPPSEQQ